MWWHWEHFCLHVIVFTKTLCVCVFGQGYFNQTVFFYGGYNGAIISSPPSYNMQLAYFFTTAAYMVLCGVSLIYRWRGVKTCLIVSCDENYQESLLNTPEGLLAALMQHANKPLKQTLSAVWWHLHVFSVPLAWPDPSRRILCWCPAQLTAEHGVFCAAGTSAWLMRRPSRTTRTTWASS